MYELRQTFGAGILHCLDVERGPLYFRGTARRLAAKNRVQIGKKMNKNHLPVDLGPKMGRQGNG